MEELRQVLVAKNLQMPYRMESIRDMSSEVREVRREGLPRGGSKGKCSQLYYDEAKSQSDSRTVASGRQRAPWRQTNSSVDFYHALNAKRIWGKSDLRAKLVSKYWRNLPYLFALVAVMDPRIKLFGV